MNPVHLILKRVRAGLRTEPEGPRPRTRVSVHGPGPRWTRGIRFALCFFFLAPYKKKNKRTCVFSLRMYEAHNKGFLNLTLRLKNMK